MPEINANDPILIHIGYHKTATKWLQAEFFADESTGFKNCHSPEIRRLSWDVIYDHAFDFSAESKAREFETQFDEIGGSGHPVLSWERFSGSPHSGGFDSQRIADRLRAVFPNARVLIVIREQKSMILSSYKQFVRAGGTNSVKDYVTRPRDVTFPVFRLQYFAYDQLISYYQELFGSENVTVLPYEMFVHEPEVFLSRIFAMGGLDSRKTRPVSRRTNAAFRGATISIKRRLNPFVMSESFNGYGSLCIKGAWRIDEPLHRLFDRIIPDGWHKSVDKRRRDFIAGIAASRFAASNRRSSELIGIDLARYGYETDT